MRYHLLTAFLRWVEVTTSIILYMAERVPEDMRVDLVVAMQSLVDEIKKDV